MKKGIRGFLTFPILAIVIILHSSCHPAFWGGFARGLQSYNQTRANYNSSSSSTSIKCPSCDMTMYFTGKVKSEYGKMLYLYSCPSGHYYWVPASSNLASTNVKNPCPICGLGTYFTGETYFEGYKLMKVYQCPLGHKSVKSQ